MELIIKREEAEEIGSYLVNKPYFEVCKLIDILKNLRTQKEEKKEDGDTITIPE